jgi:hypothetical protein
MDALRIVVSTVCSVQVHVGCDGYAHYEPQRDAKIARGVSLKLAVILLRMQHMTLPEHKLLHFARCIAND